MCLCALLVMCDVMMCVCVGVSVIVPVAFLLFNVCVFGLWLVCDGVWCVCVRVFSCVVCAVCFVVFESGCVFCLGCFV